MDTTLVFGIFPDGFRMTYKDLWDAGSPVDTLVHQAAWDKLKEEHGGEPKMYWSAGGIEA